MAVTVGATLTGVTFPLRHTGLGPYKSSTGVFFWFGRDSASPGLVRVMQSTDPMTGFTSPATTPTKQLSGAATTAFEAMSTFQVGDVVHMATQPAGGAVYYNAYNMSSGTWLLNTSEVASPAPVTPTAGTTFVSLVVRSNGNVVIAFNGGLTASMSGFNTCAYRERTGVNTYDTAVRFDNGGSINWLWPLAALGDSDRVHFFLKDNTSTGGPLYQRTLTATNALQTFPASFVGGAASASFAPWASPASYVSGGTRRVVLAMRATSVSDWRAVYLNSSDAPTTTITNITPNTTAVNIRVVNAQAIVGTDVDGTTVHAFYSNTTSGNVSLQRDQSTDGGATWGTDVAEWANTINVFTTGVYDRSGTKLAIIADVAGTVTYGEIPLGSAPVAVNHVRTITDALGMLDSRAIVSSYGRILTDNLGILDSHSRFVGSPDTTPPDAPTGLNASRSVV